MAILDLRSKFKKNKIKYKHGKHNPSLREWCCKLQVLHAEFEKRTGCPRWPVLHVVHLFTFCYLFQILLTPFLVLFIRHKPRYRQGVVLLLGKFKSKGMFSFSFPKSTNPTFSNLCFWFVQALGNDNGGKEKGPVESSGGRGREGQRETEDWEGEK